jgi:predicted DNA-binding transcriptional regulator YafY
MRILGERIPRLLLELPWLFQNRNVSLDTFCKEFSLTRDQAIEDLTLLTYVGPGRFGGELVDIQFDEENISVIDSQGFDKSLKLNSFEALLLLLGVKFISEQSSNSSTLKVVENKLVELIDNKHIAKMQESNNNHNKQVISESISSDKEVLINYINSNFGTSTQRRVKPLTIYSIEGNEYFDALAIENGSRKTFRFDRLVSVETSSDKIIIEQPLPEQRAISRVRISSPAWNLSRILDLGLTTQIIDERLIIEMDIYDEDYLLDLILRLGLDTQIECETKIKSNLLAILNKRIEKVK